jgi:hypothetical protein
LLRHKFSNIAYVAVVNFNAEKRKSRKFGNPGVLNIFQMIKMMWRCSYSE